MPNISNKVISQQLDLLVGKPIGSNLCKAIKDKYKFDTIYVYFVEAFCKVLTKILVCTLTFLKQFFLYEVNQDLMMLSRSILF